MKKSKIKCPKCKSNTLNLIETWNAYIEFEQIEGEIIAPLYNIQTGDPTGVSAECQRCGYKWKTRLIQIPQD